MASSSKAILLLFALFAAALLNTCRAAEEPACGPEDIRITTALTGRVVSARLERAVTVENACAAAACPQDGVVLRCSPAAMAAAGALLDGTKIRVVADHAGNGKGNREGGDRDQGLCLVGNGWPIAARCAPVTFTYAADKRSSSPSTTPRPGAEDASSDDRSLRVRLPTARPAYRID
ncbi:hypothetical protein BRADI_4g22019v3 [Brachypodium distachyon]|uniref:Uncharacterized protein n=1 Tax=Brachypodium distachyon TaxID=15368 RepID=A0A2K2CPC9_BRADI|nr:hypothetical protein BRADI_4g22019v3 [Brachypodium distachyon]